MKYLTSIFHRIKFWFFSDRIGPDMPGTHWCLYFKTQMRILCASKFMVFGKKAEFRPGAYAINCSKISIGDRVTVRPQTMLFAYPGDDDSGCIIIENDVLLGSGVHVYVCNHAFNDPSQPIIDQGHSEAQTVMIGSGSWIGANAILLPGVCIGRNAIVGAGSVVTKSVPANTLVAGNPAQVIKVLKI